MGEQAVARHPGVDDRDDLACTPGQWPDTFQSKVFQLILGGALDCAVGRGDTRLVLFGALRRCR